MRRYKRFKIYNKRHSFLYFSPKKILYFKRSKWLSGQNKLISLVLGWKLYKQKQKALGNNFCRKLIKPRSTILSRQIFLRALLNSKSVTSFLSNKGAISGSIDGGKSLVSKKFTNKQARFKKVKKKNVFLNCNKIIKQLGVWNRRHKEYANSLALKNKLSSYFDGGFTNKFFRNEIEHTKEYNGLIGSLLVKPEFRIDVLLWRLQFFPTLYAARIAFRSNLVLVNGKHISFNSFVKQGDVIKINTTFNFRENLNQKLKMVHYCPFVEVDYYLNTIVVLATPTSLSAPILPLIVREKFNCYSLKNYIRNK